MKPDEYLKKILEAQALDRDSTELKQMQQERDKIEAILKKQFSGAKMTIRYGGSKAKNTMIKKSFDLDILVYFDSDDEVGGKNLKEIYDNVAKALAGSYSIQRKTSAIRLLKKDQTSVGEHFSIDIVPGRFTSDDKTDVFLHQENSERERLKTNPDKHIEHVRDSEVRDAIKLLKLWKIDHGLLNVKTFLLELLIVKTLAASKSKNLDEQLKIFWETMVADIDNIRIEDPANPTGNDLSELLTQIKSTLKRSSEQALAKVTNSQWDRIFGPVQVDEKNQQAAFAQILKSPSERPQPWRRL